MTASQVIAKMAEVYRTAKSYMDNAEYAEHFTDASRGVPQQTHPHVTSVLLNRPNRFRITRFVPAVEGPPQLATVASDGKRLLADVSDFTPQVLEAAAPEVLTPEKVAPDPLLREALMPVPMENLFPQLSLLLVTEAHPSWPPLADDRLEMLPPKLLVRRGHASYECFRVRVATSLGAYVYWIDRESFLLHRLELPSDEVRKLHYPDRRLGSYRLIIDFFDVAIDVEVPDDAFQLDIPDDAVRVEKFEAKTQVDASTAGSLPPQRLASSDVAPTASPKNEIGPRTLRTPDLRWGAYATSVLCDRIPPCCRELSNRPWHWSISHGCHTRIDAILVRNIARRTQGGGRPLPR